MAQQATPRLYDGFVELSRGVHSGKSPRLLTRSHVAFAVNTTFRGDVPRPRPGWEKLDVDLSRISGRFQGAHVHEPLTGEAHLLLAIGGYFYGVDVIPVTKSYQDVTPAGDANSGTREQAWFASTPGFTVVQDGQARALIYNGTSMRRAITSQREVPVGTVMAYGNGRLWVALPDKRAFVASDLIYGPSGTPGASYRDSVLRFTENEIVNGGGAFGVPFEAGEITGMKFVGVQDTSTGQGPLLVGTTRSTFSVNAPFDREVWAAMTSPIQTVLLPNGGPTGANAMASINGDVWYRDQIGVRSVQTAYRDFGKWTNTPLSRPVRRVMDRDDRYLLQFASCVEFDNRLLMTVTPQREHDIGVYHLGLVALDFDQISDTEGVGGTGAPVWEGLWTGLNILQLVTGEFNGVKRCFAIVWSGTEYEIWEMTRGALWDNVDNPIEWSIETPEYAFEAPGIRKELKGAKLWLRDVAGSVTITAQFAPDGHPVWQDWDSFTLCATVASCGLDGCYPVPKMPQPRNPVVLSEPERACLGGQPLPNTVGYTHAARLEITGQATLTAMRIEATPVADDRLGPCRADEACTTVEMCETDLYGYGADD